MVSALVALGACSGEQEQGGDLSVERALRGDTTIVSIRGLPDAQPWTKIAEVGVLEGAPEQVFGRVVSIAVSPSSDLYVVDRQASTIRVFDAAGTYLDSWGRSGEGPGELGRPDAGSVVLPDGRLVVRDRGNARMQLYTSQGDAAGTWPVLTGQFINRRPLGISGDTVVNPDVINPLDPITEWRLGLVRILGTGQVLDTLPVPSYGRSAHQFVARDEGNTASVDLPFDPTEHWAFSPSGYVVHGVGDAYEVMFDAAGSPLKLDVEVERYPVEPELRTQERQRVLTAMRWLDPSWTWDGPRIPADKPAFSGLHTGQDGRVWVLRETTAYETDDPDYDPEEPYDTEIRWRVDRVLDGFAPDGSPVGSGILPRDLDDRVPPVLRGDTLWAVTVDDLGVQRVATFVLGG